MKISGANACRHTDFWTDISILDLILYVLELDKQGKRCVQWYLSLLQAGTLLPRKTVGERLDEPKGKGLQQDHGLDSCVCGMLGPHGKSQAPIVKGLGVSHSYRLLQDA